MLLSLRAAADVFYEQRPSRVTSSLSIGTSLRVDLTASSQPSALVIGTSLAVELTHAPQPGSSLTISTGLAVSLRQDTIPISTSMAVSLMPARTASRMTIGTGSLQVTANGAALHLRTAGARVSLIHGQQGSRITLATSLNVNLIAAGQSAFAFTRDLVIAGQSDLNADILSDPVLLGIEFTDRDFASVANGGRIQQTGAEDVQFTLIPSGTVLNHNIVGHDALNGTIVFDLKLPRWEITQDVPVRMSYGFVGQMPGSIAIRTGLAVGLTAADSTINWFDLPNRSGRAFASGPANWWRDNTQYAAEEADVALLDAGMGSSTTDEPNNDAQQRKFTQTWDSVIGGTVDGILDSTNTQFEWNVGGGFGFGNLVNYLPDGAGWLIWVVTLLPESIYGFPLPESTTAWNDFIAGTHDTRMRQFGRNLVRRLDLTGHPLTRLILNPHRELNKGDTPFKIYPSNRDQYKQAMERAFAQIRTGANDIRAGAGREFHICHRPAYRGNIGPLASYCPDNVDCVGLSWHPGDNARNRTELLALQQGNAARDPEGVGTYGIATDLPALATALSAAQGRVVPMIFPEWSPKFEAADPCPIADIAVDEFRNLLETATFTGRLVCDCVYRENIRDVNGYLGGDTTGQTNWAEMVPLRKTRWSGIKSIAMPPANSTLPAVTGNNTVGSILSCSQGEWTGTAPINYAYQWRRGVTDIVGANTNMYTAAIFDIAEFIFCRVTASNTLDEVTVDATGGRIIIAAGTAPANSTRPQVTSPGGSTLVGTILSCSQGEWTGTEPIDYDYQWRRGVTDIVGASTNMYTAAVFDIDESIFCQVTASNSAGELTVDSSNLIVVTAPPVNSIRPAIGPTGSVTVGTTLNCSQGEWTGTAPINYAYRWRRGTANISGDIGDDPSYVTRTADVGNLISCRVTASNSVSTGVEVISSNSVTVLAAGDSDFVVVATPYWTTLPAASITRPAVNEESPDTQNFTVAANRGIDLTDRIIKIHRPGVQKEHTVIKPTLNDGSVMFGVKIIGFHNPPQQVPAGRPNLGIWQMMKFGSSGQWRTGALVGDGGKLAWDDACIHVYGTNPANEHHVECFALYQPFDGIRPGAEGDGKLFLTTFYVREAIDEAIENDSYQPLECKDFLIDGCHTFISTRRGKKSTANTTFPMTFSNGLIRIGRDPPYFGGWGGGGTASHNDLALFTGRYVNSTNRGTPTLNANQYGFGHSNVWKDGTGHNGPVIMRDCIFYDQGMSLGGRAELRLPEKSGFSYTNVLYLFVGETPVTNNLPTGVTLNTNRAECDAIWARERDRWLLAHGNSALDGNDFDFLH